MFENKNPKTRTPLPWLPPLAVLTGCVTAAPPQLHFSDNKANIIPEPSLKNVGLQLGTPLSQEDIHLLAAQEWLQETYTHIGKKRYEYAESAAFILLNTPGLSKTMYRWTLSAYAMARLHSLTPEQISSLDDFNQKIRQDTQSTYGWQELGIRKENLSKTLIKAPMQHLAQFEAPAWWNNLAEPKKSPSRPGDAEAENTAQTGDEALNSLAKMEDLLTKRKHTQASRVALPLAQDTNPDCATRQFSRHVLAQSSRVAQNRADFFSKQEILVRDINTSPCGAKNFAWNSAKHQAFVIDAKLWLARLLWERGNNTLALPIAEEMLLEAAKAENPTLALDAAHIVVGRLGLENFTPQKNAALADELLKTNWFSEKSRTWLKQRLGLFQYLAGHTRAAAITFSDLAESSKEDSEKSEALYWRSRALLEEKERALALESTKRIGIDDPLSYADLQAGKLWDAPSGRISTDKPSAFAPNWLEAWSQYVELSHNKAFPLFQIKPPQKKELENAATDATLEISEDIVLAAHNARLLTARIRDAHKALPFSDFLAITRENSGFLESLLRHEARALKASVERDFKRNPELEQYAPLAAWHMHMSTNDAETILFIGKLRESFSLENESTRFLYLLFYPRPYEESYRKASEICAVDKNILYGISRQESLMNPSIKSPVGAVGLMQLLPSTAKRVLSRFPEFANDVKIDLSNPRVNTLAGACYFADLMKHYNGNMFYAIAAYNAGENAVDQWVARRAGPAKDDPMFIEFIPFNETQKYVKKVYRNIKNMEWIYGSEKAEAAKLQATTPATMQPQNSSQPSNLSATR